MSQGVAAPRHDGTARPTFVLGVGAQKAGTTWLGQHLRRSPQYQQGYRKEYHVFDARDLASEEWMRRRIVRLARESLDAIEAGEQGDAHVLHRMAMYADERMYFEYFTGLVTRRARVHATGDLTPDYGMLSPQRMTTVREGFERRGVRTVAVFLMRDPVERVWSHIRMKAHRGHLPAGRTALDELVHHHADPSYAVRTQYHHTLDALGEAFGDDAHVGLYETLFSGEGQVRAITDLVGVAPVEPDFATQLNASPRDELAPEVARAVAAHYGPVYREVARRRPDLAVEQRWRYASLAL